MLQLMRELDPSNDRDVKEAYRNGLYLTSFKRVGKYKDEKGFIFYRYM